MKNFQHSFVAFALLALAFFCAPAEASAQSQRTFVSTFGSDSNTAALCSRPQPCRTFAAAMTQTNANGEVIVLDSGGYGAVTIDKAVQIIAPLGVHAAITANSGNGITVNAPAGATVVLRGLYINNINQANDGIQFNSGQTLHVENCVVSNFAGDGLSFGSAGQLFVVDSVFRNNGFGVFVFTQSGTATAVINRSRAEGNLTDGFLASSNASVTVRDSVASGNASRGFRIASTGTVLNVESCIATGNQAGISSASGRTARVSGTMITSNTMGLETTGQIISYGNNRLGGNTTNGAFTSNIGEQ